jgi:hypothetical protein
MKKTCSVSNLSSLKMDATGFSETFARIYETTRRHIPEDSDLNRCAVFLMQSTTEKTKVAGDIDMSSGNNQGQFLRLSTLQGIFCLHDVLRLTVHLF